MSSYVYGEEDLDFRLVYIVFYNTCPVRAFTHMHTLVVECSSSAAAFYYLETP